MKEEEIHNPKFKDRELFLRTILGVLTVVLQVVLLVVVILRG